LHVAADFLFPGQLAIGYSSLSCDHTIRMPAWAWPKCPALFSKIKPAHYRKWARIEEAGVKRHRFLRHPAALLSLVLAADWGAIFTARHNTATRILVSLAAHSDAPSSS
jgi:hypothetical protein